MRNSKLASLLAAAAFATLSLSAAPVRAQQERYRPTQQQRFYDPVHKDYHAWNSEEAQRYRTYLGEQRMKYRDFSKLSQKQQRAYWQWRHENDQARQ